MLEKRTDVVVNVVHLLRLSRITLGAYPHLSPACSMYQGTALHRTALQAVDLGSRGSEGCNGKRRVLVNTTPFPKFPPRVRESRQQSYTVESLRSIALYYVMLKILRKLRSTLFVLQRICSRICFILQTKIVCKLSTYFSL